MFLKLKFKREIGFTLIETAAVVFATALLLAVVFRVVSIQPIVASANATQIYQTSTAMANNWKRLSQAAGVPYGAGATYWTASNPLLACATTSCASTGDGVADGQRIIRLLAEGPSAMNAAYASAWTQAHMTPMTGLQKSNSVYYLQGSIKPSSNIWPTMWGSGAKGVEFWAMGPIFVYYQTGVTEDVAVELARKYGNIEINSPSQTQTSGPVHFWTADSGGAGFRAIGFEFQ